MHEKHPTPPKRRIRRKAILIIAGGLAVVVVLLLFLCHFVGIRSTSDMVAYHQMWREHYHPIWKDLALGRIKKGDDLETLLQKYAPLWRNDAGPYTELRYAASTAHPGLTVMAKEGKLIAAAAGEARWRHAFFDAPEQGESFGQAWMKFRKQKELEVDAYKIHCAVTAGQDVFLSKHVERREVPDPASEAKQDHEMMRQLREIYGDRYIQFVKETREELVVEATEVLAGDLEPGTTLTFPKGACDNADLNEPETVFLSVPARDATEYMTVPRGALEWYQSLTPQQIQELEARRSAQ